MTLDEWADKHGVYGEAIDELREGLGIADIPPPIVAGESEAAVQTRVRIRASRAGCRLWRNNVGAITTDDGRHIRYGLANESKAMNLEIKSSDLIGIQPLKIRPFHVGQIIGQFMARECKKADWVYRGDAREEGQLRFIQLVASMGGDAAFTNGGGKL